MKLGLITTLDTNIGDDFIRVGLLHAFQHAFPEGEIQSVAVNKHEPHTAYPPAHPIAWSRFIPNHRARALATIGLSKGLHRLGGSRFDDCDVLVQCGAPVFFHRCWFTEWSGPLWHDLVGRLHPRVPILNLAAGSSYPWEERDHLMIRERDRRFIEHILKRATVTSVRDDLAEQVARGTLPGAHVEKHPCSALLAMAAVSDPSPPSTPSGQILINYMPGGGHYDYGQGVQADAWRDSIVEVVGHLRKHHPLAFLCHDERERSAARALGLDLPVHLPTSHREYHALASSAACGIFNRMHAAVAHAGLGIPSVAIGTDTRMLMVQQLGLPTCYVKEASPEYLLEIVEGLLPAADSEKSRLLTLKDRTLAAYADLFRSTLAQ